MLTVNATFGAVWYFLWLCSLVDEKENYRKSYIRNNRVEKISSEPGAVINRVTYGSRAIVSRPLVYKMSNVRLLPKQRQVVIVLCKLYKHNHEKLTGPHKTFD